MVSSGNIQTKGRRSPRLADKLNNGSCEMTETRPRSVAAGMKRTGHRWCSRITPQQTEESEPGNEISPRPGNTLR